jgi:hypothetical protein
METVRDLREVIDVRLPDERMVLEAARIEADHPMPFADAFGAALAVAERATLWTGDIVDRRPRTPRRRRHLAMARPPPCRLISNHRAHRRPPRDPFRVRRTRTAQDVPSNLGDLSPAFRDSSHPDRRSRPTASTPPTPSTPVSPRSPLTACTATISAATWPRPMSSCAAPTAPGERIGTPLAATFELIG